jgi:hypothetical protein
MMAWRKNSLKLRQILKVGEIWNYVEKLIWRHIFLICYFVHRWRGDLGEERRDWVGVEMEEEINGGGSGSYKVIGVQVSHMTNLDYH